MNIIINPEIQMKNNEGKLQASCVQWFRFNYRAIEHLLFAIPNGGLRNIKTAKRLKAEGVVAGVPDLFLAVPTSEHCGLFIEMKFGKNKPTEAQKYMMLKLENKGYRVEVVSDFDQFCNLIKQYLHE